MAPIRTQKRMSATSEEASHTPQRGPIVRSAKITQGQKQALIDNLQLEITERARKLRAQYALQAQSLRTRVELRINRIPSASRKANMGELLSAYLAKSSEKEEAEPVIRVAKTTTSKPLPSKSQAPLPKLIPSTNPRGTKRSSDTISSDKENTAYEPEAPAAKKRVKAAPTNPSRRQVTNPSTVLSPKSSNSRTLPQSPIRPPFGSPYKGHLSRPTSPLKPVSPIKAAAAAAASSQILANMAGSKAKTVKPTARKPSAKTAAPKRGAATTAVSEAPRTVSSASNTSASSGTSTGTTVVKKFFPRAVLAAREQAAATTTKKKTTTATGGATTKKAPVAKAVATSAPPSRAMRSLRSRA